MISVVYCICLVKMILLSSYPLWLASTVTELNHSGNSTCDVAGITPLITPSNNNNRTLLSSFEHDESLLTTLELNGTTTCLNLQPSSTSSSSSSYQISSRSSSHHISRSSSLKLPRREPRGRFKIVFRYFPTKPSSP